jgi:hypothetical protein
LNAQSRAQEKEMDKSFKAARLLVAILGFALPYVTPAAAENEQVHFYNSSTAAA